MLEEVGFRRLRSGKGDHVIFARGTERVALDGGPNHESMEIVITMEREPGAPTVGVYSEEPASYVIRDASISDKELLVAYADALEEFMKAPV